MFYSKETSLDYTINGWVNCNPGQNIWHIVTKSSKIGQDLKKLSNFACFLTAIVKV